LRLRGKVLGALTVQSAQSDAFDQDTVTVLQTMVDQIAIALDNARLLAESQDAVETVRRVAGELTREGWSQLMRAQMMPAVRSVAGGVVETEGAWPAEAHRALHTGQTVHTATPDAAVPLAVPVQVRGTVIGVIDTFKPAGNQWTPEEIALAETLAEQLGIALESARLYQDTQRRAAREQLIGEVTGRIREPLDLHTVLQTAVREMGEKEHAAQTGDFSGLGPGLGGPADAGFFAGTAPVLSGMGGGVLGPETFFDYLRQQSIVRVL
jgi:GAF domain-containing protein